MSGAPTAAFDTVLVANRGEIARRIIRSARRMGLRTVAVYSDADRDALHCRDADLALHIGASPPGASYLNQAALLAAARAGDASAVHPGYGFLAENAEFARACDAAGLRFIGPTAAAMDAMGNKAEAKRLMLAAGVPCVPGYQGADQGEARMQEEASRIGYPVMIKAAAGGGGRGMRRVDHADGFLPALRSARSEAEHAFSNGELIIEKAIIEPRHIEIQVFADAHGNVVHLGERDCSVQRRHQKVIEESPSPAVSPALRARMGEVAVAAARAIGYRGAGTLEFLLDREGCFYFMEMNTRLQVEHAVTEAVAGVDLVEWQLRVAMDEPLPLDQERIDARLAGGGHAIEVRLCAEDPARDFLPQSGTVALWRAPEQVRTDHALASGCQVSPYYDSMLAKLVAHGADRGEALRKLARALDATVLLGLGSNRRFLAQCLAHPVFAAGQASTAFVEACMPAAARAVPAPDAAVVAGAAALLAWRRAQAGGGRYPAELRAWSSSISLPQLLRFTLDGGAHQLQVVSVDAGTWDIGLGAERLRAALLRVDGTLMVLAVGGRTLHLEFAFDGNAGHILLDGVERALADTTDAPARRAASGAADGLLVAPMNGRIAALPVAQGEQVRAGQVLLVVEAMKMEHAMLAPCAGTVGAVFAKLGEQVAPGQALLEIAAASPP